MIIRNLSLFLISLSTVFCCQPPLPAFQAAPRAPQPPQFGFQSNSLVSGVPAPPQPPPPPSPQLLNSIDQELTPFSSKADVTPYPGYIPPPPPGHGFQPNLQQGVPVKEASLQSITIEELPSRELISPTGCPSTMKSVSDVISCLHQLPPTEMAKDATRCEFENNVCRFQPTAPSIQVARLPDTDHYEQLGQMAGRSDTTPPKGNFLALMEPNGISASEQISIAMPVQCQNGSGFLTFDFWFIGNSQATLRVCTQDGSNHSCTQNIEHGDTSSVSVEVVHPNRSVFEVEIIASNLIQPTVFIVDNIEYKAMFCEDEKAAVIQSVQDDSLAIEATPSSDVVESFFDEDANTETADSDAGRPSPPERDDDGGHERLQILHEPIGPPTKSRTEDKPTMEALIESGPPGMTPFESAPKPTLPIKKLTPCQLMDCSFEKDMCGYSNHANTSYKRWKWTDSDVGNPHTGIRTDENTDGGFLYVGTDSFGDNITTYVLESPALELSEDVLLSVDIYRRSNDITLQLCLNSPDYCPYSIPKFDKKTFWRDGETFSIRKETKKVFFKAIQWRKFKWLAIDNIRISGGHKCVLP